MTYLATEMLLYLLAAAVIGLVMGWLIRGLGQGRNLKKLHNDLRLAIDAEREAHHQTRLSLDQADVRTNEAVEAAKAEGYRSISELKQTIEAERETTREVRTALDKAQADLEDAAQMSRAADQEAVDQALKTAIAEKAAASEALAKEAQSRAQIEELRLLIGAEKLAADSARAELEETRAKMEAALAQERAAHQQAKVALHDIRSTLTKTLGSSALGLVGDGEPTVEPVAPVASGADRITRPTPSQGRAAAFSMMTDIAAAGEALNNPDHDEADIEDREDLSLDLSSPIDVETGLDEPEPAIIEPVELMPAPAPAPANDRIEILPFADDGVPKERPSIFHNQRPAMVDDLKSIRGISPEIEDRLHANGCYLYRQLASLTPSEIEWLADKIEVTSGQIADELWVQQAKILAREAQSTDGSFLVGSGDRQNSLS